MRLIDADELKSKKEYSEERHEWIVSVAAIDWINAVKSEPVADFCSRFKSEAMEEEMMPKPYYTDYVSHIMRFYVLNQNPASFRNEVDRQNWEVADKIINELSGVSIKIVKLVFGNAGRVSEGVYKCSCTTGMPEPFIWETLSKVTKRMAEERGLI